MRCRNSLMKLISTEFVLYARNYVANPVRTPSGKPPLPKLMGIRSSRASKGYLSYGPYLTDAAGRGGSAWTFNLANGRRCGERAERLPNAQHSARATPWDGRPRNQEQHSSFQWLYGLFNEFLCIKQNFRRGVKISFE